MKVFSTFLIEEAKSEKESGQLKHITHAEDRPLLHGHAGFEHAFGALNQAHEHMKHGYKNSALTMKYDGSPSIVFGHHPKSGKFFVATKSAFNKKPKLNYTHADIEKNHGHAPGLVSKLKSALHHLPKVAPKKGVYQGDLMFTHDDLKNNLHEAPVHSVSFTPNTITYTAHGDDAKKIGKAKVGIVVHQKYHGSDPSTMTASPHVDHSSFTQHPDVYTKSAEHDTSKIQYGSHAQDQFQKHMKAAKDIHDAHGGRMYKATEKHQGDGGHLATYINHTVRNDEVPTASGLKNHVKAHYERLASKLKSQAGISRKKAEGTEHLSHIEKNKSHYEHLLSMHHHLTQAKNVLVKSLESHEGGLVHHIGSVKSKPEGFVVNHEHSGNTEPTKLVNRSEFAKANFLKNRG